MVRNSTEVGWAVRLSHPDLGTPSALAKAQRDRTSAKVFMEVLFVDLFVFK